MAIVKRPKSISALCVIAIILVLLAFPMLFTPTIKRMGDFIPMILGIIITLQFVSLIGIWHMKRWGVQLFVIMFFTRMITFMFLELYTFQFYFNIFYSIIFLVFFFIHYKEMDSNL